MAKDMKNSVKVSTYNEKMGHTPSISLPPVESCGNSMVCRNECYAVAMLRYRQRARAAWGHNLALYQRDPGQYFASLKEWIYNKINAKRKPKHEFNLFRYHVSGDIIDNMYIEGMGLTAEAFPQIQFLAFTKMYYLVDNYVKGRGSLPSNLNIVLSGWPGLEMVNPHGLPIAWMQDGTEHRIPGNAVLCTGVCESCGMCWQLDGLGVDVYFNKH